MNKQNDRFIGEKIRPEFKVSSAKGILVELTSRAREILSLHPTLKQSFETGFSSGFLDVPSKLLVRGQHFNRDI